MKLKSDSLIRAMQQLENIKTVAPPASADKPLAAKRRFSVMRGRTIYVCPTCIRRVKQFSERCGGCYQRLEWDIRVVK